MVVSEKRCFRVVFSPLLAAPCGELFKKAILNTGTDYLGFRAALSISLVG